MSDVFPPGWYPDPAAPTGASRWWDGRAWTGHVVGRPSGPPPRSPDAAARVASERRLRRWAQVATVFVPTYLGGLLVTAAVALRADVGSIRHWIHQLQNDRPGTPAPAFPHGFGLIFVVDLLQLAIVPFVVLFMVWQFRAASAARSLGYPAAHSPGWGVGSWFVPIVDYWMPFQALRDCLPPGHPRRGRPWLVLGFGLGGGVFSYIAVVTVSFGSPGVGIALMAVMGGLFAVAVVAMLQTISAVGTDHDRAVRSA